MTVEHAGGKFPTSFARGIGVWWNLCPAPFIFTPSCYFPVPPSFLLLLLLSFRAVSVDTFLGLKKHTLPLIYKRHLTRHICSSGYSYYIKKISRHQSMTSTGLHLDSRIILKETKLSTISLQSLQHIHDWIKWKTYRHFVKKHSAFTINF